jgi:hypothetical protein
VLSEQELDGHRLRERYHPPRPAYQSLQRPEPAGGNPQAIDPVRESSIYGLMARLVSR